MFPLRDFLNRFGRKVALAELLETLRDLFPNITDLGSNTEIYKPDPPSYGDSYFELEQSGYSEPRIWKAEIILLTDSLTATLLRLTGDERGVTTLLITSITSASLKLGKIMQEKTNSVIDK